MTVATGTDALTRFATGFVHQNVADAVRRVHLRVAVDGRRRGRTRRWSTTRPWPRSCARRSMPPPSSRWTPAGPAWRPAADAPAVDHWDDATAAAAPDERAGRVGASSARPTASRRPASARRRASRWPSPTRPASASPGARRRRSSTASRGPVPPTARTGGIGQAGGHRRRSAPRPHSVPATRTTRPDLEPGSYEVVLAVVRHQPPGVPRHLRLQRACGGGGSIVREAGRAPVRPGDLAGRRRHASDGRWHRLRRRRHAEVARRPGPRGRDHRDRQRSQDCEGLGSESTGHAIPGAGPFGALPANLVLEPGAGSQEDPPCRSRPRPARHRLLVHARPRSADDRGDRPDAQRRLACRGRRSCGRSRTCASRSPSSRRSLPVP